ncbi:MAG TPA: PhoU domain-containing protein [Solirubrobacteraceae bacterium]
MDASGAAATAARSQFRDELLRLEEQTVVGLDLVILQLDRALESLRHQDVELAATVVADDDRIDDRYLQVHHGVLSLLGQQAPSEDDWRLVAALLQIMRCVERMGDQCVNISTLVPLSGHEPPRDLTLLELVDRMGRDARQQVVHAKESFRTRHVALAKELVREDAEVNRLNREIFQRGVDIGDDHEVREWAMFMCLVARCLERIGDNTIDIAEQTVFVVTGSFHNWHFHHGGPSADAASGGTGI